MIIKNIGSNQTEVQAHGCRVLVSYSTPVALQAPSGKYYKTDQKHSVTTSKHINKWCPDNVEMVPQAVMDEWETADFA